MGEMQNIDRADHGTADVVYSVSPSLTNDELNSLSAAAWGDHTWNDFRPVLNRSLAFVCAYSGTRLIGFVNLAWDGCSQEVKRRS